MGAVAAVWGALVIIDRGWISDRGDVDFAKYRPIGARFAPYGCHSAPIWLPFGGAVAAIVWGASGG